MSELDIRVNEPKPYTKIKLSTILHPDDCPDRETFTVSPCVFANGSVGHSFCQLEGRCMSSFGMLAHHYLSITGVDKALAYAPNEPPRLWIGFYPFHTESSVPVIQVWSQDRAIALDERKIETAQLKPYSTQVQRKGKDKNVKLSYEFVEINVRHNPRLAGAMPSDDLEVRVDNMLYPKEHPQYEEFSVIKKAKGETTLRTQGDARSSAAVVYNLLEITGLLRALKEYPCVLLTEHNGERFVGAEMKPPQEMRVVYDPVNMGCAVPLMKISPITRGLWLHDFGEKSTFQPKRMNISPEGIEIDYPFVKIFIHPEPYDAQLRFYYGSSIKLSKEMEEE